MFLALIRKQIKILLRSPSELLILLLMPIVLIVILSFALAPMMNKESQSTKVELAIVQHDNEDQQFKEFIQFASKTFPINTELEGQIYEMLPTTVLIKQIVENNEISEFVNVTKLAPAELDQARAKEEFSAIIEIPKGFTMEFLKSAFFYGEKPTFQVYLNENEQISASIVQSILDFYQQQYSMYTALGQRGYLTEDTVYNPQEITSSVRTIQSKEKVSSSIYYTFAMSVMFILYISSTVANQAFLEKNLHIFDRIILAKVSPFMYLASIIVSSILLAILQVTILFAFCHFIFGITFNNWLLYLLLTVVLAFVVGGIAALLSSLNYRYNSADASNIYSNAIVAILAFLGGSFINVGTFSPILAKVGLWTPNGAALDGYLKLTQGGMLNDLGPNLIHLSILAIGLFVLAVLAFPRRGGIA